LHLVFRSEDTVSRPGEPRDSRDWAPLLISAIKIKDHQGAKEMDTHLLYRNATSLLLITAASGQN
jgi:hypothetical protein